MELYVAIVIIFLIFERPFTKKRFEHRNIEEATIDLTMTLPNAIISNQNS